MVMCVAESSINLFLQTDFIQFLRLGCLAGDILSHMVGFELFESLLLQPMRLQDELPHCPVVDVEGAARDPRLELAVHVQLVRDGVLRVLVLLLGLLGDHDIFFFAL